MEESRMRWTAKNPEDWHGWFAWYPVVVSGQWVWLERLERRDGETFCGDYTEFRVMER